MIYAVVVEPSNYIRGYYDEEKMAQEHADFINGHLEGTFRNITGAKVIKIWQDKDKEEKAAQ